MRQIIAKRLRKLADFIMKDDVPTAEAIRRRRMKLDEMSEKATPEPVEIDPQTLTSDKVPELKSTPIRPKGKAPEQTATPWRRRPRRQTEAKKEWNEDTKTQKRREYQKQYRLRGEERATLSPKSKYVPKNA